MALLVIVSPVDDQADDHGMPWLLNNKAHGALPMGVKSIHRVSRFTCSSRKMCGLGQLSTATSKP